MYWSVILDHTVLRRAVQNHRAAHLYTKEQKKSEINRVKGDTSVFPLTPMMSSFLCSSVYQTKRLKQRYKLQSL